MEPRGIQPKNSSKKLTKDQRRAEEPAEEPIEEPCEEPAEAAEIAQPRRNRHRLGQGHNAVEQEPAPLEEDNFPDSVDYVIEIRS